MRIKTLLAGVAAAAATALAGAQAHAATNLIVNGDFSAGLFGWSDVNSCCDYTDGSGFHEGAVNTDGQLSQTFADVLGGLLTLDFDFASSAGYQFVDFNGVTVPGSLVSGATGFQHYTFALGAGTGSDTITFHGQNNPSWNTLDNVAVTQAVPEPAAWALMLTGFFGAGTVLRRRQAVAATA